MKSKAITDRLKALQALLDSDRPRSRFEHLAIQRQIADLDTGNQRGLVWDEDEAQRGVRFFGLLKHWKGDWAGTRFGLEPWQEHCVVAPLLGWYRGKTRAQGGARRFTLGYVEIPRKNGKSTFGAGFGLHGLVADHESGAEVYSAATKRDQATIVFRDAKNMLGPELRKVTKSFVGAITCPQYSGSFQPLSSDYNSLDGLNISRAIIDELHAHKTRDLYDVLLTAMGARKMPLLLVITTAGYDRSSICWEQREIVRQILEGTRRNDSYFGFIATCEEQDDWRDPRVWWKANPNLNVSLKEDSLRDLCSNAISSPAAENNFRRKHLDQWTEQSVRVIPMDSWRACAGEVDERVLIARTCYAGLDMASTRDVAAFVLLFPMDDGSMVVLPRMWMPRESGSDRSQQDKRVAATFAQQGHITFTAGNELDYPRVEREIMEDIERFDVAGIGFDPHNARELMQRLVNAGYPADRRHLMVQNAATYNEPFKKLLGMLEGRRLKHPGNPALDWMAGNTAAHLDSEGKMKPDKGKSADKIDGICSLLMALALAMGAPQEYDFAPGSLAL